MLSFRSLTISALALSLMLGGCDRQSATQAQGEAVAGVERSHQGSELPDFSFADPAGQQIRLSSLKGKPLLINLWATWCAPCLAELPALDRLAAKGKVRVLTVSQDMAQPAKVAAFLKQHGGARLEPWLDPENSLAFHYNAQTLPTSIFYDAQGREVWRITGPREWDYAGTAALLAEAR